MRRFFLLFWRFLSVWILGEKFEQRIWTDIGNSRGRGVGEEEEESKEELGRRKRGAGHGRTRNTGEKEKDLEGS